MGQPNPNAYIGEGISFPFQFSARDGGVLRQGSDSQQDALGRVRQSLFQIFGTTIGERFFRRDFGSRLRESVFEPMNNALIATVVHDGFEAATRWEPRAELMDVYVKEINAVDGQAVFSAAYRLVGSNVSGNMVLPFFDVKGG